MRLFSKKRIASNSLGARGEKAAIQYLKNKGYSIITTNYANLSGRRLGEIDIIAKDRDELVFIEVKTRSIIANDNLLPEENINRAKLYKLNKIAQYYLIKNNILNTSYRFDAITLIADTANNSAQLRHLTNIFF
jgi:putative endonuclease